MTCHMTLLRQLISISAFVALLIVFNETAVCDESAKPIQHVGNVLFEEDVVYGNADGTDLKLDIIRPAAKSDKPLPAIIYIHGGGWSGGDKFWGHHTLYPFAESGHYFTATINYRLSGDAKWPAQIHDCKAAIRWVRAHAKAYNVDPDRIGVWGSSAGGHLVFMLATSGNVKSLEGDSGSPGIPSHVNCGVSQCGVSDFVALANMPLANRGRRMAKADEALEGLLGGKVLANVTVAKEASPITYVTPNAPPLLITHGTNDQLIPIAQSELLHLALKKAGADSTFVKALDSDHVIGCPQLTRRIAAFFDKNLRDVDIAVAETPIRQPLFAARVAMGKLVGAWKQGNMVVKWQWAPGEQCLIGSVFDVKENPSGTTMLMRFDPTTGGIAHDMINPFFEVRENRYTQISETCWRGTSTTARNNGVSMKAEVVLKWLGPDEFQLHFENILLHGKLPQDDVTIHFIRNKTNADHSEP